MRSIEFEGRDIEGKGSSANDFVTPEAGMFDGKVEEVEAVVNKVLADQGPEIIGKVSKENDGIIQEDGRQLSVKTKLAVALSVFMLAFGAKCTTASSMVGVPREEIAMAIPQEMTDEAEYEKLQTQQAATPTPEKTLSPAEVREQRLNEIINVIKENDNSFTIEELGTYLKEHGEGWEGGVEGFIKKYEGSSLPFKYFFIKDDYNESGVYLSSRPYIHMQGMPISDINNFPTPEVANEEELGELTESVFYHLWIIENGNYSAGWVDEPNKYISIIYIREGIDDQGNRVNEYYFNGGGYTFVREGENERGEKEFTRLRREQIENGELTDEQIEWLYKSIENIEEGYTEFTVDKEGNIVDVGSNFLEWMSPPSPTSSDTFASEIN